LGQKRAWCKFWDSLRIFEIVEPWKLKFGIYYIDITVQHVSAYTVVRAMCQVNGGWSFSATWDSETPEPIHLKSGMCD